MSPVQSRLCPLSGKDLRRPYFSTGQGVTLRAGIPFDLERLSFVNVVSDSNNLLLADFPICIWNLRMDLHSLWKELLSTSGERFPPSDSEDFELRNAELPGFPSTTFCHSGTLPAGF